MSNGSQVAVNAQVKVRVRMRHRRVFDVDGWVPDGEVPVHVQGCAARLRRCGGVGRGPPDPEVGDLDACIGEAEGGHVLQARSVQ